MFDTNARFLSRTGRAWGLLAIFVAAGAIVLAAPAAADDKDKKSSYEVTVLAIRATKSNSVVSGELKAIAAQLRRQFKYTGFKLERKKQARVNQGKPLATSLVGAYKAKITPLSRDGNRVKLKIEISKREGSKDKPLINTTVTLDKGKYQMQGGWKIDTKSGDVLIVGVAGK